MLRRFLLPVPKLSCPQRKGLPSQAQQPRFCSNAQQPEEAGLFLHKTSPNWRFNTLALLPHSNIRFLTVLRSKAHAIGTLVHQASTPSKFPQAHHAARPISKTAYLIFLTHNPKINCSLMACFAGNRCAASRLLLQSMYHARIRNLCKHKHPPCHLVLRHLSTASAAICWALAPVWPCNLWRFLHTRNHVLPSVRLPKNGATPCRVPRRFVWNLTARIHRSGARWGLWATWQSELSTNPPGGAFC